MEEKNKKIIIGNATTIINTISLMIAGIIFGILGAFGLKLPLDQYSLAGVIGLIIASVFSYFNAKYHNTFFDKGADILTIDVTNLTDAQVDAINNFIENAGELNTVEVAGKTFNKYNDAQLEDIDPALNYEEDDGC